MKAISLWQPWASAIAVGAKQIETRTWWTAHRGPLAIHAAKKRDHPDQRALWQWRCCETLRMVGYRKFDSLPFGAIVATCRLVECFAAQDVADLSDQERALGNYQIGHYAWILEDIKQLPSPIPWRGEQGLFNIDFL